MVSVHKRFLLIFLSLIFISHQARADMDPKVKALGAMAVYGTLGGALLGTASLAFGAEPRAIAKGASLGLYAGLLFGGYVVTSHILRNRNKGPVGPQNPYSYPEGEENPYNIPPDAYGPSPYYNDIPYAQRSQAGLIEHNLNMKVLRSGLLHQKRPDINLYYLPILNLSF